MTPRIDRRKALAIRAAGELAQDELSELPRLLQAEKADVAAKLDEIRTHVVDAPLRDVIRWDDETLFECGLRREVVQRAIDAVEDLEILKRRMAARRTVLEPKARLAARMRTWLQQRSIVL